MVEVLDRWNRVMLRLAVAIVAVVSAMICLPPFRDAASSVATTVLDRFDRRPVRRILIIGNSRTYYHDMPGMLRRIADSAHTTARYDITIRALQGGSLEDSWNDAETQSLLARRWDDVIIQAESRAQSTADQDESFHTYARKLIDAAETHDVMPAFIVNWVYGESLFVDAPPGSRAQLYDTIQRDFETLRFQTGARLIDTAAAWERVHAAAPTLALYEDGNHPSLAGSYVSAVVLYSYLARTGTDAVTYVPWGMTAEAAALIRQRVGNIAPASGS